MNSTQHIELAYVNFMRHICKTYMTENPIDGSQIVFEVPCSVYQCYLLFGLPLD